MEALIQRHPELSIVRDEITTALELFTAMYEKGGKLLVCGNGGSAADAEHIVGELMKSFRRKRPVSYKMKRCLSAYGADGEELSEKLEEALPAISLCSQNSLSTAYANDKNPYMVFAQMVNGLGKSGDMLLALTTSGNSRNCLLAAYTAKAKGMGVIAITGKKGGDISRIADVCIKIPEHETYLVQELTVPVYHFICDKLEESFFGDTSLC